MYESLHFQRSESIWTSESGVKVDILYYYHQVTHSICMSLIGIWVCEVYDCRWLLKTFISKIFGFAVLKSTDQWLSGYSLCYWSDRPGFDSQSGQTKDYKNWYSQLSCFTFSIKRDSVKPTPCVADRWQLDSKTERSLRCLLAKANWWIKCNYNYNCIILCKCYNPPLHILSFMCITFSAGQFKQVWCWDVDQMLYFTLKKHKKC